MKLLIFGNAGSGKTTLAQKLSSLLGWQHLNADKIREQYNDWDFSEEGRIRQAERMIHLSSQYDNCIVDFVCPYTRFRQSFDFTIFMDTIDNGRFVDTNNIFEKGHADIVIDSWDYDIDYLINTISHN